MHALRISAATAVCLVLSATSSTLPASAEACPTGLNQIDYAMYFLSDVRDAERCAQRYVEDRWVTPDGVVNPAISCPDMFSWRLYIESVRDGFWTRWADEQQNWPAEPYPLCIFGGTPGVSCCQPGAANNPQDHCPVFPGDTSGAELRSAGPQLRIGRPSIMHQLNEMAGISATQMETQLRSLSAMSPQTPECDPSIVDKLVPEDPESIGRVIRQTNAEITVRDRPFHDYLFENNLYNSNGVRDVFANNSGNIANTGTKAVQSSTTNSDASMLIIAVRQRGKTAHPGDPQLGWTQ